MYFFKKLVRFLNFTLSKSGSRLSLSLALITIWIFVIFANPAVASDVSQPMSSFLTLKESDQIPYKWDAVKRVVAVGDIHGDLNALLKILYKKELIDRNGHWIGGDAHLVMMGDLIDGSEYSKEVLDYLMGLEKEAEFAGGKLHVLLGNHEVRLLFGDIEAMSNRNLKSFAWDLKEREEMERRVSRYFYNSDGRYAKWFQTKNAIVVINNVAFVHAGLKPEWFENKEPRTALEQINSTVRYLIKKAQSLSVEDKDLVWTVGLEWQDLKRKFTFSGILGPIWDRGFGTREKNKIGINVIPSEKLSVDKRSLRELLESLGLVKLAVGHNPVRSGNIYLNHPYWSKFVTVIDTKISEAMGGELSAFEMNLNTDDRLEFEAEYFKRPQKENRLYRVLEEIENGSIGAVKMSNLCEYLKL
jgi:hypothetical protein